MIGSGFGGLFGTKALKRADVDVTMIAKTTHHLFQPLLYQVATGILSEGEIAPPTREVLARQKNAAGAARRGHRHRPRRRGPSPRTCSAARPCTPYDSLIVAAGAGQSYFGNDQFAEFAPGMKSIDDALELRGRIFGAFELAELGAPPRRERRPPADLRGRRRRPDRRRDGRPDRRARPPHAAAATSAPSTPARRGSSCSTPPARCCRRSAPSSAPRPRRELEKLGVEVLLGAMVTDVDERGLEVKYKDGRVERIEAVTKIWAAGVQASALDRDARRSRPAPRSTGPAGSAVNPDLTLPGHPEVFVVGDMIDLDHLPGVAQVAIQGAKYAAEAIDRRLEGKPPQKPFKYFDKGSMATISRFRAVALIGKLRLTGFIAWLMWLAVHLFYLTGFKNRVTAVLHWAVSFLGRGRSERTATEQQIFGRMALHRLEHGAADLVSPPPPSRSPSAVAGGRRAELEAIAAEEARLTDAGERGVAPRAEHRLLRAALLEVAGRARVVLGDRLARPPGQDEHALGLDGHALGADDLAARPGLDAVDPLDPAPRCAGRRAACAAGRSGSASPVMPGLPPAPAASPSIWSRTSAEHAAVHAARAGPRRPRRGGSRRAHAAALGRHDRQRRRDGVAQPHHGVAPGPAAAVGAEPDAVRARRAGWPAAAR